MNERDLRLDAGTIENPDARKREKLFSMIPATMKMEDRLAAIVYLLSALHLARDDSALQSMLPDFSERQIREARVRAGNALNEGESELGNVIRTVKTMMGKEQAPAGRRLDERELFEAAKKHFGVVPAEETKEYRERKEGRLACMATAFITGQILGRKESKIADLLGVTPLRARHFLSDGKQEYSLKLSFYKDVHKLCKEAGILIPEERRDNKER